MIAALLSALVLVPSLSVSGKTLQWTPAGSSGSYRIQEQVGSERTGSVRVDGGTSYTPEAQPGKTVSYRVRPVPNGEWSNAVTIAFPSSKKGKGGEETKGEPPAEEPPKEEKERPKKEPPAEEPPFEEEEEGLPEEPPLEEHPGGFFVGLNAGYWGSSEPGDVKKLGTV